MAPHLIGSLSNRAFFCAHSFGWTSGLMPHRHLAGGPDLFFRYWGGGYVQDYVCSG